jgi:hypothetical protein
VAIVVQLLAEFVYWAIDFPDWEWFSPFKSASILPAVLESLAMCVATFERSSSCVGVVGAVWLVTAMAGCWRPEKTWLDRTGRALGVFWLLLTVAYWLSLHAFP